MRAETLARLREFGFKTYDAYMASDLWATNKARANLIQSCWVCGTNTYLQVHHCSYEHVCDEKPGDLIVLCGGHHQAVHSVACLGIPLLVAHIRYKENPELAKTYKKYKRKSPKYTREEKVQYKAEKQRKIKLVEEERVRLLNLGINNLERLDILNAFRISIGVKPKYYNPNWEVPDTEKRRLHDLVLEESRRLDGLELPIPERRIALNKFRVSLGLAPKSYPKLKNKTHSHRTPKPKYSAEDLAWQRELVETNPVKSRVSKNKPSQGRIKKSSKNEARLLEERRQWEGREDQLDMIFSSNIEDQELDVSFDDHMSRLD